MENKTRRLGERVTQENKRKKMKGRNVAACIISVLNEKNGKKGEKEKRKRESERLWERRTEEERNERNIIKIIVPFFL